MKTESRTYYVNKPCLDLIKKHVPLKDCFLDTDNETIEGAVKVVISFEQTTSKEEALDSLLVLEKVLNGTDAYRCNEVEIIRNFLESL